MEDIYTIPLSQLEKEFSLERIWVPEDYDTVLVRTPEVSRPGLALAGFFGIFERDRIQIIGNAEHKYLEGLTPAEREKPDIINSSRKKRIANGAGTTVEEVNKLLKQYDQTNKLMKQMTSGKKFGKFGKLPF